MSVLSSEFIAGLHILVGVMGEFLESFFVTAADDRQQDVKTSSHHAVTTSK